MFICTYKIQKDADKTPEFVADIYHNRAEVWGRDIESKTYFYYDNIGEILADYGLADKVGDLVLQ